MDTRTFIRRLVIGVPVCTLRLVIAFADALLMTKLLGLSDWWASGYIVAAMWGTLALLMHPVRLDGRRSIISVYWALAIERTVYP